jgi:hypothetical protein
MVENQAYSDPYAVIRVNRTTGKPLSFDIVASSLEDQLVVEKCFDRMLRPGLLSLLKRVFMQ